MTKQILHIWYPKEERYVEIPLVTCPTCQGWTQPYADLTTGKYNPNHCKKCLGSGWIPDPYNKYVVEAINEYL
jgi:hypothetical protein